MASRRAPAPVRVLVLYTLTTIGLLLIVGAPAALAVLLTGRSS